MSFKRQGYHKKLIMKKSILFILVLLGLQKGICNPVIGGSPNIFFNSLVSSISTIQGNMTISLGEGEWSSTVDGVPIVWQNSRNQLAVVYFNYSSGILQADSYIKFKPAIHNWTNGPGRGLSLYVDSISYNQIGGYKNWKVGYDTRRANDPKNLRPLVLSYRLYLLT